MNPDPQEGFPWREARAKRTGGKFQANRRPAAQVAQPMPANTLDASSRSSSKTQKVGADPLVDVPSQSDSERALSLEEALKEVATTAPGVLHRSAAFMWRTRAIASYRICVAKKNLQECLSYFYLGEHYREAALSEAAFGEQWLPLGHEVDASMTADRDAAYAAMRRTNG